MRRTKNMFSRITKLFVMFSLFLSLGLISSGFLKAEQEKNYYVDGMWKTSYSSKEEAVKAGDELNQRIVEEGTVLLENKDEFLPLRTNGSYRTKNLTLFGHNSLNPLASGKREDMSAGVTNLKSDIYSSLTDGGYNLNPVMKERYDKWIFDYELFSDYALRDEFNSAIADEGNDETLLDSFELYNDAAVVVLGSTGAKVTNDGKKLEEDALPEGTTEGHSLQLDIAQFELLDFVNDNFENVVVVINTSIPMELGFIKEYSNIKAAILIGEPGGNGFNALGRILNGEVNPSGRLADIYPADMTTIPSWDNFKSYDVEAEYEDPSNPLNGIGTRHINITGNQYLNEDEEGRAGYFVDYKEGIYNGYRYFETRGAVEGEQWYEDNVVYPFGYGLSYTDFKWELVKETPTAESNINEKTEITLKVKVTNEGTEAGKEVVQAYYTAPYTAGGIEKSHVVLSDFAKTSMLNPGQSEVVTLTIKANEMASYDWNDANNNGHSGYELEKGTYKIKLMKNSHKDEKIIEYNVVEDIKIKNSLTTGYEIENQFDYLNEQANQWTEFSRSDFNGTFPTTRTKEEKILTDEEFEQWVLSVDEDFDENAPWYNDNEVKFADPKNREETTVILSDLTGRDYNDPLWDELLDQITLEEAIQLINLGGFQSIEIPHIGKPFSFDTDGPHGWSGSGVGGSDMTRFATAPVIAATWSKELSYEMGEMIGEQGLWGNSDVELGLKNYTGWYAPAINTHRTPLDRRFQEYFSEDGVLAGNMAGYSAKGARSKGAYVTMKHFALHEDGSYDFRGIMDMGMTEEGKTAGLSVWVNEQALREIYLKPFQLTVEIGDPLGAMSSFSRIGHTWAGASYPLLTEVLRNEWGFEGLVLTDIAIYSFLEGNAMIRAGGDLVLSAGMGQGEAVELVGHENTHLNSVRNAAKNILYVVANTNAMMLPKNASVILEGMDLESVEVGETVNIEIESAILNTVTQLHEDTIRYKVVSGKLPEGLTLDELTGHISGKPTEFGVFNFEIQATADSYKSGTAEYHIEVNAKDLKQVVVKFDTNGGSELPNLNVTEGSTISNPNNPTKDGFEFAGWYDNKELSGEQVEFNNMKLDEDTTLYAKWVEVEKVSNALEIITLILSIVAVVGVGAVGFYVFKKK